ncbi:MAG: DEAD/DEAH box helicase, partial [Coriobacteriia bacterium]|nr:DEAD/DEAH box helicase [Coriobacteriia bacterium]
MTKFEDLGLSEQTLEAIDVLGYDKPTPIQQKAIPLALEGRDLIAGAQTGTGKTAAFCLPCLDRLPHAKKHCGPLMLVVTPTRELADQISDVCGKITKVTKHRVTTVVGGVSYNPQREALKRGTDVLIATPGRLEDLIGQGAAHLDQVQMVVLDEADRMLDMGFLPAIKRIVGECTGEHQTLLFSATIDKTVEKVAREMLNDPEKVEVARRGETAQTVEQSIVRISHAAKPSALLAILEEHGAGRVIVFARTRHRVDSCSRRLRRAGYKTGVIHSDRSQSQRRRQK